MARGACTARRIAVRLAVVLFVWVAVPALLAAQRPPITIPPAQLPAPGAEAAPAPTDKPNFALLLPNGVQILHDSQGAGLAMYGALRGRAPSATGALRAVFSYSQAFDPTPSLQIVLADQDDRHAQALFTAAVQGQPVVGIGVVALSDSGGDVTVLYDNAVAFSTSFPRIQKALSQNGGEDTVILSPLSLDDGGTIRIAQGWRVTAQGPGFAALAGPRGEFISLGSATPVYAHSPELGGAVLRGPCCDPIESFVTLFPKLATADQRRGMPAQTLSRVVETKSDPAPNGGSGALILSELRVGGEEYNYFAAADALPGFADPWIFTVSGAMAPRPIFAPEFRSLMQIWNSYRAVHPRFGVNLYLPDAVLGMSATQAMLKPAATTRATADYNASAEWSELINCAAHDANSACAQSDAPLAQKLADRLSAETGHPWRVVPLSELQ